MVSKIKASYVFVSLATLSMALGQQELSLHFSTQPRQVQKASFAAKLEVI